MKRILLVDDDALFRTLMAGLLPWNDLGYTLLQAENGRDAIRMLHRYQDIALVFTDMSMPILDGVELVHYVSEHLPGVRCVALSAYDNFEFVKPSFQSGVDDYLLKHTLTREQLMGVLEKYAGGPVRRGGGGDCDSFRFRFLFDLVIGAYEDEEEAARLLESLELPPLRKNLLLATLLGDGPDGTIPFRGAAEAADSHMRTVLSMMQSFLERIGQGVAFQSPDDHRVYLLATVPGFESLLFARQTAAVLAEQARQAMLRYFNLQTRLLCAPLCRDLGGLRQTYLELMRNAGFSVSLPPLSHEAAVPLPDREVMEEALRVGTTHDVRELIASTYRQARRQGSPAAVAGLCPGLIELAGRLAGNGFTPEAFQGEELRTANDAEQEAHILAGYLELHARLSLAAREKYSPVVYGALSLICSAYGNEQLSAGFLSRSLHANSAYLSRLFKAQTGQTLSDYIAAVRLARARQALAVGGHSVKEVATLCGYGSYNYFFKVFKDHMNMTPREYQIQALSPGGAGKEERP